MSKKELKRVISVAVKTVFIISIVVSVLYFLAYNETHYTRTGFVKKKPVTVNEYYFYDSKGNEWIFTTDEELNSNMTIEVKMFNNCTTDYIYDDMIIDYQVISDPDSEIKIEIVK